MQIIQSIPLGYKEVHRVGDTSTYRPTSIKVHLRRGYADKKIVHTAAARHPHNSDDCLMKVETNQV